jgi:polyhydroxybutyrate depolymerase
MNALLTFAICAAAVADATPLTPGDHLRRLEVDGRDRSYRVHVPGSYDQSQPAPVVLAFHGAAMNARTMAEFSGLDKKSDEAGFLVVYPNGTGPADLMLFWNAGAFPERENRNSVDDVAFVAALLDDLALVARVDEKRVFATGMSNGGMLCYRLASELAHRIAAIAPVAGTMAIDEAKPSRPVPVMHFHGTADALVAYESRTSRRGRPAVLKSVEETARIWARLNGCSDDPIVTEEPDRAADETTVTRSTWGPGRDGGEVVLFTITGGGHTWPGREAPFKFLGRSTLDISANDLMWEFFERHARK